MSAPTANTKRLYIGNLDETIDEYAIVKLFEPFGKITFIEVMVHWVGPKKGVPRGFCFLEFEKKEQALKAINALHGKIVKGKSLVVSFAHMTPEQDEAKKQQRGQASNRPNSLSILRGTQKMKNSSTNAKIQAIERKLLLLQKQQQNANTATTSTDQSNQHNSSNTSKSTTTSRHKPY